ncbi:hypothetical protein VFPFJ_05939 [Purpureocillium lilacinum]|uniref:Uncharacterized protein n=1 Tax=Purpureocillium lilacinum TaxID=33203 RepID=A0A179HH38_PURLI|nr:hypothetical protein VFPFJ_05939 [Purpureocillium lilacinum]OAQ89527.1 hypothetical protein VFPFJ_05939 [Purpureocillium lilacinum]
MVPPGSPVCVPFFIASVQLNSTRNVSLVSTHVIASSILSVFSNGHHTPQSSRRRHGRRPAQKAVGGSELATLERDRDHNDNDDDDTGAAHAGLAAHTTRARRPRGLPADTGVRHRLLRAVARDARRGVRPRGAGTRAGPGRGAELLCAQVQHLQRGVCEARLGVDDVRLCLLPADAPERRADGAGADGAAAARGRPLGARHGVVVPRHAVVLWRAAHRPRVPLDGRAVRAGGARGRGRDGAGGRGDHGGGVQVRGRAVARRARHLGPRLPAGAGDGVPDAGGGLGGAAVERQGARGAVRGDARRGAQERGRRGRGGAWERRGQHAARRGRKDGRGGGGPEPLDAADDGYLLSHVV